MAKAPIDLRSLARAHTQMGLKVLAGIAACEDQPAAARVSAVALLLDRGWGKAPQPHTGEDGESGITVTIRHITEGSTNGACGGSSTAIPQKLPSPPPVK